VLSPLELLIPIKIIEEPDVVFMISVLVILKTDSPNKSILSTNSGMIDMFADTIVKRVNSILCPASKVSIIRNTLTEKDLEEPLPVIDYIYQCV
jgi:hypothetical protein